MTWHIVSVVSGNVFFTTNNRTALQRELAYLVKVGYNVTVKEAK